MAAMKYLLCFLVFISVYQYQVLAQESCNSDKRGGGCEMFCRNVTQNQTACDCKAPSELSADGKSCHMKPHLVYGVIDSLVFVENDTVNEKIPTHKWLLKKTDYIVHYITQDYEGSRIFCVYSAGGRSYKIDMIRIGKRTREFMMEFENEYLYGIAYDHIEQEVFVAGEKSIHRVIDFDRSDRNTISQIFLKNITARSISIDSKSRLMFLGVNEADLIRINMTDKTRTTIFKSNINSKIKAITLDRTADKIFWTSDEFRNDIDVNNNKNDTLWMMNYDGTCIEFIDKEESKTPISIVFWQGFLYWSDSQSKRIYKTSIEEKETEEMEIQLDANVFTIDFYGNPENYMGQWSQWAEVNQTQTNSTICRRNCVPLNQTYYTNKTCFKQDMSKFINSCGVDPVEKPACSGASSKDWIIKFLGERPFGVKYCFFLTLVFFLYAHLW
ncbi:low-density lipoprotein receptor-related protein 2-like isoform X1 [Clytia hemisphaerica]|uniref:Uncharacterized protein n=2 Tax=Clytia hemisphaerica TaxID=252671 RepID=A0A7M5TXD1_9CNID